MGVFYVIQDTVFMLQIRITVRVAQPILSIKRIAIRIQNEKSKSKNAIGTAQDRTNK